MFGHVLALAMCSSVFPCTVYYVAAPPVCFCTFCMLTERLELGTNNVQRGCTAANGLCCVVCQLMAWGKGIWLALLSVGVEVEQVVKYVLD